MQQPPADGLPGAAFEQPVVGHHDPGSAVLGQHGHDVLQEIELLVRGGDEEILTVLILALAIDLPVVANDPITLLLPEGRVSQDYIEGVAAAPSSASRAPIGLSRPAMSCK